MVKHLNRNMLSKILFLSIIIFYFFLNNPAFAESKLPQLFLFLGSDHHLKSYQKILENPCVSGAQIIYTWKELEPKKDIYNFSQIKKDINFLNTIHKKLFIQIQDRSFQPNIINIPDYMRNQKIYHGGIAMQFDFPGESKPITEGWVARVWDPAVRERFQILFKKLSAQFDGQIYCINLPETAVDFDPDHPPEGFTSDKYFNGELENINALRAAFHQSIVMQYVNFFPGEWNNDHHYMSKLFADAVKYHISLGGPDIIPYRKGQMKNSYPFFHQYKNKIAEVGMAVQQPDYSYKKSGKNNFYKFSDFYFFARDYLGASILFWNNQEPFLSNSLVPHINNQYFACRYSN